MRTIRTCLIVCQQEKKQFSSSFPLEILQRDWPSFYNSHPALYQKTRDFITHLARLHMQDQPPRAESASTNTPRSTQLLPSFILSPFLPPILSSVHTASFDSVMCLPLSRARQSPKGWPPIIWRSLLESYFLLYKVINTIQFPFLPVLSSRYPKAYRTQIESLRSSGLCVLEISL